jgi:formylmethanofuran dehydrogenase subunit B
MGRRGYDGGGLPRPRAVVETEVSDASTSRRTVEDATCLGCACLCDDIGIVVEGDRIVEARNACPMGRDWYGIGQDIPDEDSRINGQPAAWDEAIDRAATILSGAKAPLVWGLSGATIEAQRQAVAIADRIGAFVGIAGQTRGGLRPFQRFGQVGATLGEVKDRADLIVYDVDFPIERLPRLRERYADAAVGRFIPGGRAGRTIIRLGRPGQTSSSGEFDHEVIVPPKSPMEFYATLRAAVNGAALDRATVDREARVDPETIVDLAGRLKRARYGAFFVANWTGQEAGMEAILALVRDLNTFTRFVAVHPTTGGPNRAGAEAVLAWQAGAAGHVDFSTGHPRHLPGEEAVGRIERGEVDAALLLVDGANVLRWLVARPDAARHLGRIPRVVIRSADAVGASWTPRQSVPYSINALLYGADVVLPAARPGIDEGGTVARFDGVMLPLRPPFPGRRPSQAETLRALAARLSAEGTQR